MSEKRISISNKDLKYILSCIERSTDDESGGEITNASYRLQDALSDARDKLDAVTVIGKAQKEVISELHAELEEALPNVCGVCWTSSFEPTEDGERCLCCWQHEQFVNLTAENKRLRDAIYNWAIETEPAETEEDSRLRDALSKDK